MRAFADGVLDVLEAVLGFLHDLFEPIFGANSWGWAIIALTIIVRVLLLPLAIKQTRSMRAMQAIQPQMKALQKKYKVDRELMRKDPEKYKARRAKLNEEMMALYREEGANPAASCLPLLAQAPIFLALFWTLNLDRQDVFSGAPFYFVTGFVSEESREAGVTGLATVVSSAGWPGWLLILLMSGSLFWSQRQMMRRNRMNQGADAPTTMAQQQKILLYVMPAFLAVISFRFPLGILLYWVTTNFWQVIQQAIILREVSAEAAAGTLKDHPGGDASKGGSASDEGRKSPGASSGGKPGGKRPEDATSGRSADSDAAGTGSGKGRNKGPNKGRGKANAKSGSGDGSNAAKDGTPPKSGEARKEKGSKPTSDEQPTKRGKPSRNQQPTGEPNASEDRSDRGKGAGTSRPVGDADGRTPRNNGDSRSRPTDKSGGSSPRRSARRDHLPRRPRD